MPSLVKLMPIGFSVMSSARRCLSSLRWVIRTLGLQGCPPSPPFTKPQVRALDQVIRTDLFRLQYTVFHAFDSWLNIPIPAVRFHSNLGVFHCDIISNLLASLPAHVSASDGSLRVVEVGVDTARNAAIFLQNVPNVHYVGIDPYPACGYDSEESCARAGADRYVEASLRLSRFHGRAQLFRATCEEIAPSILHGSVQFVWIDGLHTYERVVEDFRCVLPFLQVGGYIAGHDYGGKYPGVSDAVHEVFSLCPPADGVLNLAPDNTFFWQVGSCSLEK